MIITACHRRRRGDAGDLSGSVSVRRISEAELTAGVESERSHRPVRQSNNRVTVPACHRRRRGDAGDLLRRRSWSRRVTQAELTVCIVSERSHRAIGQANNRVTATTCHRRRRGDAGDLSGTRSLGLVSETELSFGIISKRSDRPIGQSNDRVIATARHRRRCRDAGDLLRRRLWSRRVTQAELTVCIVSERSHRPIGQENDRVIITASHRCRRGDAGNLLRRCLWIPRVTQAKLTIDIVSEGSHRSVGQADDCVTVSARHRRRRGDAGDLLQARC